MSGASDLLPPDGLLTKEIIRSADNALLLFIVLKEMELGHIAEFFRTWRRVGMHERMALLQEEVGGPANTAYAGNRDTARQYDP